jgi:hypothetical protein
MEVELPPRLVRVHRRKMEIISDEIKEVENGEGAFEPIEFEKYVGVR